VPTVIGDGRASCHIGLCCGEHEDRAARLVIGDLSAQEAIPHHADIPTAPRLHSSLTMADRFRETASCVLAATKFAAQQKRRDVPQADLRTWHVQQLLAVSEPISR
jgi:hypothetical protein